MGLGQERRAGDTPDACPLPAGVFRSLLTGELGLELVVRWIYGCWLLAVHPASAGPERSEGLLRDLRLWLLQDPSGPMSPAQWGWQLRELA